MVGVVGINPVSGIEGVGIGRIVEEDVVVDKV